MSEKTVVISKRMLEVRRYVLLGGLIFWVPDVLLHWLRGMLFSRWDVLPLTVLLPVIACTVLMLFWKRSQQRDDRSPEAFAAVAGIWILGPAMMSLGWISSSAHFAGFRFVFVCTAVFPICTPMMSTYDGTLLALLITTALLPLLSLLRVSRGRPVDCA